MFICQREAKIRHVFQFYFQIFSPEFEYSFFFVSRVMTCLLKKKIINIRQQQQL